MEYDEFNLAVILKVEPNYTASDARGVTIQHHSATDCLVITTSKKEENGEWTSTSVVLTPSEYQSLTDFFHWKEAIPAGS